MSTDWPAPKLGGSAYMDVSEFADKVARVCGGWNRQ